MMKIRVIFACILLMVNVLVAASSKDSSHPDAIYYPILSPFVTGEGAYSWYTSNKKIYLNNTPLSYGHDGWGGRIAGGLELFYASDIAFSGELGWEYLAQSSAKTVENSPYVSHVSFSGFDMLIGTSYRYKIVDFFIKGGFFLLNRQVSGTLNYSKLQSNLLLSGTTNNASLHTFALPEIKVGTFYNISDKLALSLSYMHIFGSDSYYNTTVALSTESFLFSTNNNTRPPSFNTIQFGVRYYLA